MFCFISGKSWLCWFEEDVGVFVSNDDLGTIREQGFRYIIALYVYRVLEELSLALRSVDY